MRYARLLTLAWCILANASAIAQAPTLIGLLDYAAIYDETSAAELTVVSRPELSASPIATLDRHGIRLAKQASYLCKWERDLDTARPPMGCTFAESSYEIPALAVIGEASSGWYRVALDSEAKQSGWVKAADGYHSLTDLLASSERLTYFTGGWDGRLYLSTSRSAALAGEVAHPGKPPDSPAPTEVPYRVRRSARVAGELWLEVELLDEVCGEHDSRVTHAGWVPVHSTDGKLWAWFHSRGC